MVVWRPAVSRRTQSASNENIPGSNKPRPDDARNCSNALKTCICAPCSDDSIPSQTCFCRSFSMRFAAKEPFRMGGIDGRDLRDKTRKISSSETVKNLQQRNKKDVVAKSMAMRIKLADFSAQYLNLLPLACAGGLPDFSNLLSRRQQLPWTIPTAMNIHAFREHDEKFRERYKPNLLLIKRRASLFLSL